MQSPSAVQLGLHDVASAQTRFPAQLAVVAAAGQPVAAPVQRANVSWLIEPHADEHVIEGAAGVHAPAPLQPPAVQVPLLVAHAPCGSWLATTFAHVPALDGRLHARQPEHAFAAVSPQTPSGQWPL